MLVGFRHITNGNTRISYSFLTNVTAEQFSFLFLTTGLSSLSGLIVLHPV
jgi:hypothetical protein